MPQPFVHHWRLAVRDSEALKPTDRFVALTLSTYMNSRGVAKPGKETLARICGIDPWRTLSRSLQRLEDGGYLRIREGGGRGLTNVYTARIPKGPAG